MGGYRGGTGGQYPPGKSKVAIGFLRNSGTNPLEKQLDTSRLLGSNCFSREARTTPCEFHTDDQKRTTKKTPQYNRQGPLTEFSGSAHVDELAYILNVHTQLVWDSRNLIQD